MKDLDTKKLEIIYEDLGSQFISQVTSQMGLVKSWPLELKTVFYNHPEALWDDFGKHEISDQELGQFVYGGGTRGTNTSPLKTYVDDYIKTKNPQSLTQLDSMLTKMGQEQTTKHKTIDANASKGLQ